MKVNLSPFSAVDTVALDDKEKEEEEDEEEEEEDSSSLEDCFFLRPFLSGVETAKRTGDDRGFEWDRGEAWGKFRLKDRGNAMDL